MDSGMVMSMTKFTMYSLIDQRLAPRDLVLKLNNLLCQQIAQQKFISLIYAEYSGQSGDFTWAGAGHEHIIVYRAAQGDKPANVEVIKTGGIVLGMIDNIDQMITQQSITLNPGDRIVLYTDGVTEARNPQGDMLSLQGLVSIINGLPMLGVKEFLAAIKKKIQAYIQDAARYDDITLVVLGRD